MENILKGKKTFIGIAVTVIGMTGLAAYITPVEFELLINSVLEVVGVVLAVYGRIVANKGE